MLCEKTGAVLKVIPMNENGELIIEEFDALLSEKTKNEEVMLANSKETSN